MFRIGASAQEVGVSFDVRLPRGHRAAASWRYRTQTELPPGRGARATDPSWLDRIRRIARLLFNRPGISVPSHRRRGDRAAGVVDRFPSGEIGLRLNWFGDQVAEDQTLVRRSGVALYWAVQLTGRTCCAAYPRTAPARSGRRSSAIARSARVTASFARRRSRRRAWRRQFAKDGAIPRLQNRQPATTIQAATQPAAMRRCGNRDLTVRRSKRRRSRLRCESAAVRSNHLRRSSGDAAAAMKNGNRDRGIPTSSGAPASSRLTPAATSCSKGSIARRCAFSGSGPVVVAASRDDRRILLVARSPDTGADGELKLPWLPASVRSVGSASAGRCLRCRQTSPRRTERVTDMHCAELKCRKDCWITPVGDIILRRVVNVAGGVHVSVSALISARWWRYRPGWCTRWPRPVVRAGSAGPPGRRRAQGSSIAHCHSVADHYRTAERSSRLVGPTGAHDPSLYDSALMMMDRGTRLGTTSWLTDLHPRAAGRRLGCSAQHAFRAERSRARRGGRRAPFSTSGRGSGVDGHRRWRSPGPV